MYVGRALKLSPTDFADVAAMIGVTEAHIRTVCAVETNGRGFDANKRPEILFERHRFYKELKGAKRSLAEKRGLAYPRWGTRPYPRSSDARWAEFAEAATIDECAAIRSTSWGLGQVMGDEFDEAGFKTPEEMVNAFCDSERNQLIGMAKLIAHRGLDAVLLRFPDMSACHQFAKRYNGAGYAKNKYHTKLHDAFIRFSNMKPEFVDNGLLRSGVSGKRVKAMQEELNERKYFCGKADGTFGNRTRDAVLAWQADNDRPIDGTMDAEDLEVLEKSPPRPISAERSEATEKDVAETSTIVQNGTLINKAIGYTTVAVGGSEAAEQTGLLDRGQLVVEQAQKAQGIFETARELLTSSGLSTVMSFISQHKVLILIVVLGAIYVGVKLIKRARVEMSRTGEAV